MTEYKQINEKPVWILMKKYQGGRIEFVGAYWKQETAKQVATSNLPNSTETFTLSIDEIKLFGSMVDKL